MQNVNQKQPISAVKKAIAKTRSMHVGDSNYSNKKIQPWDVIIEYGLNPWDADICKRVLRTKKISGINPEKLRIQDYEKIKHICDERINQINNGDPYYQQFKYPSWVVQK